MDSPQFKRMKPESPATNLPLPLKKWMDYFSDFKMRPISLLRDVYAPDVDFRDPAHHYHGVDTLISYFEKLNSRVRKGRFVFSHIVISGNYASVHWTLLVRGRFPGPLIKVRGVSLLGFGEKIWYHEDVFDLGGAVYENLPLIGWLFRWIKKAV
jgi:hypothetical protein